MSQQQIDTALKIKNNTAEGSNTHGLVGGLLVDLAEKKVDKSDLIQYMESGGSTKTGKQLEDEKADKRTIYNVSQLNGKYDYITNVLARNAVTVSFRTLGMIISYRLSNEEWVTEQYLAVNAANWSANENWKYIGGLLPKDIYQKVDDTEDKPISPKGVKTGLLSIEGLGYRESFTTPIFTNLIESYNYKVGYVINADKEVQYSAGSYNQDYVRVKENTKYLHSNTSNPGVLFYDLDKKFISQVGGSLGGSFTTPPSCVFVRYNIFSAYGSESKIYIYEAGDSVNVSDKLGVLVGIGDLIGSVETDVAINSGNILPTDIVFEDKALDSNANPTIAVDNFKHSETYIPIIGGVDYETNLSNAQPFMWFYDKGKRAISFNGTGVNGLPFGKFKTPINAAYFRFNTQTINMSPFYVQKTTAGGAYYIPNLIVPKANVLDLDISEGEIIQVIPYAEDGDVDTGTQYFSYINQEPTRGKYIKSVDLNIANDNSTVIIAFAGDAAGKTITWHKTFTRLGKGKTTLDIERKQGSGEFICFSGVYKYSKKRANPVGGGITGGIYLPNADLCVGVNILDTSSGSSDKKNNYISLGDSITYGAGANVPYSKLMSLKLGGSFNNYAVGGAKCYGASGNVLITQVAKIPQNFVGVITCMIGINDVSANSPLGEVSTVLAKNFDSLNAGASFAEAFRLCLETILRKAPTAIVLVIPPLKAWTGQETKIDGYRQVERDICEYFAVPYTDTYKRCLIAPLTYSRLMPDSLHPNDNGHLEVMRVLWGEIEKLISYLK